MDPPKRSPDRVHLIPAQLASLDVAEEGGEATITDRRSNRSAAPEALLVKPSRGLQPRRIRADSRSLGRSARPRPGRPTSTSSSPGVGKLSRRRPATRGRQRARGLHPWGHCGRPGLEDRHNPAHEWRRTRGGPHRTIARGAGGIAYRRALQARYRGAAGASGPPRRALPRRRARVGRRLRRGRRLLRPLRLPHHRAARPRARRDRADLARRRSTRDASAAAAAAALVLAVA